MSRAKVPPCKDSQLSHRIQRALRCGGTSQLTGREVEFERMRGFVSAGLDGRRGRSMYICGQPGTGKSAVCAQVLRAVRRRELARRRATYQVTFDDDGSKRRNVPPEDIRLPGVAKKRAKKYDRRGSPSSSSSSSSCSEGEAEAPFEECTAVEAKAAKGGRYRPATITKVSFGDIHRDVTLNCVGLDAQTVYRAIGLALADCWGGSPSSLRSSKKAAVLTTAEELEVEFTGEGSATLGNMVYVVFLWARLVCLIHLRLQSLLRSSANLPLPLPLPFPPCCAYLLIYASPYFDRPASSSSTRWTSCCSTRTTRPSSTAFLSGRRGRRAGWSSWASPTAST